MTDDTDRRTTTDGGSHLSTERRQFLQAAGLGAAGLTALGGMTAAQTGGATTFVLEAVTVATGGNGGGRSEYVWEDGEGGVARGPPQAVCDAMGGQEVWMGVAPGGIEDVTNPTLELTAGTDYTLEWTNVDGKQHSVVIVDDDGGQIVSSDSHSTEGETHTFDFTASQEMAAYYCGTHPTSQRGDIAVSAPAGPFELSAMDPAEMTVEPGETVSISVTVTNTTGSEATDTVTMTVDGAQVHAEEVTLGAGESTTTTTEMDTTGTAPGEHAVTIASGDSQVSGTMTVEGAGPPDVSPSEIGIGADPSSDATWLWNGEDATLEEWTSVDGGAAQWNEYDDYFEVNYGTGNIQTEEEFGDAHLHLEWRAPEDVEGEGQSRANSGVFLMDRYEFQILDNYDNPTYADGYAGAYYAQAPPLSNPLRPPGEWQAYDLFWHAPRFEDGELARPARATLLINGVVVLAHLDLDGPNFGGVSPYEPHPPEGPITLQDHNDLSPPQFRNVWYRPLEADPVESGDADLPEYATSAGDGVPAGITPTGPATEGPPPSDATSLLDDGLDGWEAVGGGSPGWTVGDGYVEVAPGAGDVRTTDTFGDSQVHLEWRIPDGVEGDGLDRGNSGLLMLGQYQVQILDNEGNPVDPVTWAGSYPDQAAPQVSPIEGQGEWQSLDVVWQGPRFSDGSLQQPARVTVLLNETVVQSRLVADGPNPDGTVGSYEPHALEGPIRLEEHGDPVQFRNLWQRDLEPLSGAELTPTKKQVADLQNGMKATVAPDGRVFFTTRITPGDSFQRYPPGDPTGSAKLYVYDPDTGERTTALEKDVFTGVEMGGQGLVCDPDFEDNGWIYFFYSPSNEAIAANDDELAELDNYQQPPSEVTVEPYNVVSRFTMEEGTIDPATEEEIIRIPGNRERCCHVGGALEFDNDGNLLITTGDDTDPFESSGYAPIDEREDRDHFDAQRTSANSNDLRGSLLRITPLDDEADYEIPDGNLFTGSEYDDEPVREEVYAMGFRNPFTLTVDEETNEYYLADYGPDSGGWDPDRGPPGQTEYVRVSEPGFYGWPYFTGENVPYRDYDFETGESGDLFDPQNPVNVSPNNTGITQLPQPARSATIAAPYSWSTLIDDVPPAFDPYVSDEVPYPTEGTAAPQTGGPMIGTVYHRRDEFEREKALPPSYDGKHVIMDYNGGSLYTVTYAADGSVELIEPFPVSFTSPMNMHTGRDGELYVVDRAGGLFEISPGDPDPFDDDVEPMSAPYAMDCGGAHTEETVTIDGVEFDPSADERAAIDIPDGANRQPTGEEIWWPDSVQPEPIPNTSEASATTDVEIANTDDDVLYRTEHWANDELTYNFAIENGTYDVTIHLAEIAFPTTVDQQRVFSVTVQDETVVDEINLAQEVGFETAYTATAEGVEVTEERLTIVGESSVENPKFSAIEIRPASGGDAGPSHVVPYTGGGTASEPAFTLLPEGDTYADQDADDDDSASNTGPDDLSADVYLGYDADTLYLTVEVTDDVHTAIAGENMWQADSVQWAVGSGDTFGPEYGLSHVDGSTSTYNWIQGNEQTGLSDVTASTSREGTTTTYEATVPWEAHFAESKGPGDSFPFSVLVNERDEDDARDAVLEWALPAIAVDKMVGPMGTLVLSEDVPEPVSAPYAIDAGNENTSPTASLVAPEGIPFFPETVAANEGVLSISGKGGTGSFDESVSGTVYDQLYQTEAWGDTLGYEFAVENGTYDVELYFTEIHFNAADQRVFDVTVQGELAIEALDVYEEAGDNAALVRTVEDVEVTDGTLSITTTSPQDNSKFNGIAIRGAEDAEPTPVSAPFGYDAGGGLGEGTVTIDGLEYVGYSDAVQPTGDPGPSGNDRAVAAAQRNTPVDGTESDALYQTELYGGNLSFDVAIENGTYDVTLHFAELVWTAEGDRVFDVSVEGETVVDGLDVYAEAGADTAYTTTVEDVEVTDGTLSISTTTGTDNTKISGFEIRPSGQLPTGGLAGQWTFSEENVDGDTVTDLSGNGHDGTIMGGVTPGVEAPMSVGDGATFDGNEGSTVLVPDADGLDPAAYTVSAWLQTDAPGFWPAILGKSGSMWCGFYQESGYPRLDPSDGVNEPGAFRTSTDVGDGAWHHIVYRHAPGENSSSIYIDGQQAASQDEAVDSPDSNNPLGIGSKSNTADWISGTLADVRLYDRPLAPSEIVGLYEESGGGDGSPASSFTASPTPVAPGDTVSFDASGSSDQDGSISSYAWDFGDGSTGSGQSVEHSYGSTGSYDVALTVTDDGGATDTATTTVAVEEPLAPGALDPSETIALDGVTTGWEATAPGAISGQENPTLTLAEGEEYTVEWTDADSAQHNLEVRDDGGTVVDDADGNPLETAAINDQGQTLSLTFTARPEMVTYICLYHPGSMVGDVEVVASGE